MQKKSIREYCNQREIVEIAMNAFDENARPEDLDDDWIAQFMDRVRLVSDKDFQTIWGRLLATECNAANSIPSRVMMVLSQMDRDDAVLFRNLCSLSVEIEGDYSPIIEYQKFKDYAKWGITFDNIINLMALGLIEHNLSNLSGGYLVRPDSKKRKKCIRVKYFDYVYEFPQDIQEIEVGHVIFTKTGQALCKTIEKSRKRAC